MIETVCPLFEFRVFRMFGEWHVCCGFPLKRFKRKREAEAWCKRARKAFIAGKDKAKHIGDGEFQTTPEYTVSALIRQILIQVD